MLGGSSNSPCACSATYNYTRRGLIIYMNILAKANIIVATANECKTLLVMSLPQLSSVILCVC